MIHRLDLTGDYDTTIYDAARRLLAEGASPHDQVETYRNGMISMGANIGWAAKWRVDFRASGPCLARYQTPGLAPPAAETVGRATLTPELEMEHS
jgi:hypothetical protein